MLFKLGNYIPKIGERVFIADTARVIGNVELDDDVSIWYGAVLRGDVLKIKIGKGSNVQEGSTIHGEPNNEVVFGENVTIGHNCIIHGCKIGDNSLIGMGSTITDDVIIPKNCFISSEVVFGENVTIGHNCIIHGCKIGDNSLIGMGSTITDDVIIPKNCFISSESLVTSKIGKIEEGSFIKGNPAKVIGKVSEQQLKIMELTYKSYQDKKDLYLESLEEIK